ncbi:hypothetical protein JCM8202v2_003409 [Rhodotorula sphaerocarpa]
MEDWTILLISLSALCGLILLTFVIVTARVSYRRARRTKRGKLVYGSAGRREDLDGGQDDDDDATAAAAAVAGDASATEPSVPSPSLSEPMRESHFSRAQRAARRANKLFKRVPQRQEAVEEKQPGEGEGEGGGKVVEKGKGKAKGKKKPRVSRTTEAANAEQDAGAEAAAEESHVCDQQTDQ